MSFANTVVFSALIFPHFLVYRLYADFMQALFVQTLRSLCADSTRALLIPCNTVWNCGWFATPLKSNIEFTASSAVSSHLCTLSLPLNNGTF